MNEVSEQIAIDHGLKKEEFSKIYVGTVVFGF